MNETGEGTGLKGRLRDICKGIRVRGVTEDAVPTGARWWVSVSDRSVSSLSVLFPTLAFLNLGT